MSIGFAMLASGERSDGEPLAGGGARLRQLEPDRLAGVGAEDPEAARVRQHGDPAAARLGLAREEGGDVDQLLERLRPGDACLAEERVHRGLRPGERRGVGARRPLPRRRRPALHREDRLAPSDAAGDATEPARIPEGLDVHEDDLRRVFVLPPLEQVVRGDVRLVPDRDERGEAEPAGVGGLEEGKPECAALRGEADVAARRGTGREGRVEARLRDRDPEAVRPDHARAVGADEREQLLLALGALAPDLGEAGGDDDERAYALAERLLGGLEHGRRRQRDDGEVDRVRDLLDRGVRTNAGDRLAVPVHRVRGTREVALEDVAEELAADRAAPARRADDGDARRLEERAAATP